jgi:hypothetical protein
MGSYSMNYRISFPKIGQQFGRYTVMDLGHGPLRSTGKLKCKCQCGSIRFVPARALANGWSKSCGCRTRDVTTERNLKRGIKVPVGSVVGTLTVMSQDRRFVKCRCACGAQCEVRASTFAKAKARSCGCHVAGNTLRKKRSDPKQAMFNIVYRHSYKSRAFNSGIDFSINESDFRKITASSCAYCGSAPCTTVARGKSSFTYNGIDRLDPCKGYTLDNVVPCCKWCNYAKRLLPVSEFLTWARKVHTRMSSARKAEIPLTGLYLVIDGPYNQKLGRSGFKTLYRVYQNDPRGHEFNLTENQFLLLTSSPCHYCGAHPKSRRTVRKKAFGSYLYNGLDRVDNKKGHTLNNVVPCCPTCNRAKSALSLGEFLTMVSKISDKASMASLGTAP